MKKMKELYKFTLGSTVWCFTSGDRQESYDGRNYVPIAISRSSIEYKNDMSKDVLEITIDRKNDFAKKCLDDEIYAKVKLELFVKEDNQFNVYWNGRLSIVKTNKGVITLVFESNMSDLRRVGGRRKAQRTCDHALYGSRCRVNKDNFFISGIISSITSSGLVISECASKPNAYFSGGQVLFSDGISVYISQHIGANINLMRGKKSAKIGDSVNVYAGCDKSVSSCKTKFNNLNNFGGFPYMPTKNPFVGDSIY